MDKNLRKFLLFSIILFVFFTSILAVFGVFYRFSSINTYNNIVFAFILLTGIFTVLFFLSAIGVIIAYKTKKIGKVLFIFVKIGTRILLPILIFISGIIGHSKDSVRNFYITMNNLMVNTKRKKYLPKDILILLPHCLQHSDCSKKVTKDIYLCVKCGKCCIGNITDISRGVNVPAVVVTGGTAARSAIARMKPKIIISVACERDLTSGIADVKKIPVIGLVNQRPFGPCYNTTIDTEMLQKKIQDILAE